MTYLRIIKFRLINSQTLFRSLALRVPALSLAPTSVSEPVEDKVGAIKALWLFGL
jgi:hypothetical protein